MNLHKEHGKPLVQRVIDQLVAEQKLSEKVNGKQKCFVINQGSVFNYMLSSVAITAVPL